MVLVYFGAMWESKKTHTGPSYLSLHPSSAHISYKNKEWGGGQELKGYSTNLSSSIEASKLKSGKADISFQVERLKKT